MTSIAMGQDAVVEESIDQEAPLLSVDDLRLRFGGIVALDQVSITVRKGSLGALIGPNGAGKTSLFNCISGLYVPDDGEVLFAGERIDRLPAHAVAKRGVSRTFQEVALVPSLTVVENVMLGAYPVGGLGFAASILRPLAAARRERAQKDRANELLDDLGIAGIGRHLPGELPVGSLKRVELARALMSDPRLLMLDEPACGLNHDEVAELSELVAKLQARRSLSVLVVEHNMHLVRAVAEYVYVLDMGAVVAHGTLDEVSQNQGVIEAYLGGEL